MPISNRSKVKATKSPKLFSNYIFVKNKFTKTLATLHSYQTILPIGISYDRKFLQVLYNPKIGEQYVDCRSKKMFNTLII